VAKIPIIDLKAQYKTIRKELQQAIKEVLESQQFVLGRAVEKFEADAARYLGARHAVGVASGSDALLLALMALGVGPGDAVAVPAFTFVATATAVARLGATPLFVDVDADDFRIDLHDFEARLTEKKNSGRVKAVIPVHLFGRMCAMKEITALTRKNKIAVVEDAAQSFGARDGEKFAGTLGDLGCYSFFPTKNLGGLGDAGLVATDDAALAAKIRLLRAHGEGAKYRHDVVGINSRLDALQAAALSVKLRHLDDWCAARVEKARHYAKLLDAAGLVKDGAVAAPAVPADRSHVFNYYVIRARRRDELKKFLTEREIQTEIYYPLPLHLQPCFADLGYRQGDFPHAEKAAREVLALPLYPELPAAHQEIVVRTVADFYRR